MEEYYNVKVNNALRSFHSVKMLCINSNYKEINKFLFSSYLAEKTLLRMLSYHSIYQKLVHRLIKSAKILTYVQCSYWQELVFIWQNFTFELDNSARQHYELALTEYDRISQLIDCRAFIKSFYLCHIRYFQALLYLPIEIDVPSSQRINFYVKKIHKILDEFNMV